MSRADLLDRGYTLSPAMRAYFPPGTSDREGSDDRHMRWGTSRDTRECHFVSPAGVIRLQDTTE